MVYFVSSLIYNNQYYNLIKGFYLYVVVVLFFFIKLTIINNVFIKEKENYRTFDNIHVEENLDF
jgi:hypothetical protein